MLPWSYTAEFVDLSWPSDGFVDEVDITPIDYEYGYLFHRNPWNKLELSYPNDGTSDSMIESIRKTYGIVLKHRPDLSEDTYEVVGSVW